MSSVIPVIRILSVSAVAVAALLFSGCATDDGPGTSSPGVPDGIHLAPTSDSPSGAWVERGESFALVTMGSSSCPVVATEVRATADDHVIVTFGRTPNDECTADIATTTHQFDLPEGVSEAPVTIDIAYEDWPETHSVVLD